MLPRPTKPTGRLDKAPTLFYIHIWHSRHESASYKLSVKEVYMAIIRWDPMRAMLRWPNVWDEDEWGVAGMGDNLDVYETSDEVVVKGNVAGIDPTKIEITFEKGILTIAASQESEETEGKKYYRKASRSYSYRVAVPGNIDMSKEPEAKVANGVVAVTFHKAEEAKPKKIAVQK